MPLKQSTPRKRTTVPRLGGLPSTRSGALLLSAVCALIAGAVIIYAIGQYRKSVTGRMRQDTVLVASSAIQRGTSGEVIAASQLAKPTPVVASRVTPDSVTDSSMLRGRVALGNILPGQQLRLSDFGASSGYLTELAPNERAISIPLDTSHGLAGVLQPGDYVDVYAGTKANTSAAVNSSPGNASVSASASVGTRLLLSDIEVMAVSLSGGATGPGANSNITSQGDVLLKVKASDAGAVAFASDNLQIWLVLRGANAITPKSQNGVLTTINSVLHGPVDTTGTGGTP